MTGPDVDPDGVVVFVLTRDEARENAALAKAIQGPLLERLAEQHPAQADRLTAARDQLQLSGYAGSLLDDLRESNPSGIWRRTDARGHTYEIDLAQYSALDGNDTFLSVGFKDFHSRSDRDTTYLTWEPEEEEAKTAARICSGLQLRLQRAVQQIVDAANPARFPTETSTSSQGRRLARQLLDLASHASHPKDQIGESNLADDEEVLAFATRLAFDLREYAANLLVEHGPLMTIAVNRHLQHQRDAGTVSILEWLLLTELVAGVVQRAAKPHDP